jgi:predicted nucleic acid-binding protein
LHRRHRDGLLSDRLLRATLDRLDALVQALDTIPATDAIRARAGRLLANHPLSAADAFQLAAALAWCEERTQDEVFVCLDRRLGEAARREGFTLLAG